MKIVVFGPDRRVGVFDEAGIIDAQGVVAKYARETQSEPLPAALAAAIAPANLLAFIEGGARAVEFTQKAVGYLTGGAQVQLGVQGEQLIFAADMVKLHAPLPGRGSQILMAANNYADHAHGIRTKRGRETGITVQDVYNQQRQRGMRAFWKHGSHVAGPDTDLIYPSRTHLLDYEGEVAVVLGRAGKDIPAGKIGDYVWGYTLMNDWSLRDTQADGLGALSLSLAKNFDGSGTLGPCIVVGEPIEPQNVPFETRVNGELRQQGNTKGMVFSFDEYLEYLSRDMTLNPGDMICAGTCAGTAMDSSTYDDRGEPVDNRFLKPGDVVELSSLAIGTLRNRVVAKA